MTRIETATFGNREGSHQLLESSLPPTAAVLETVRFFVDRPAGHVDSGTTWSPYWGCGPVGEWWALWRGEEDQGASRKNMVLARVALIPKATAGLVPSLDALFEVVGGPGDSLSASNAAALAAEAVNVLAAGQHPAIVSGVELAPLLLREIWPRLWAAARVSLSLRTLFGVESLDEQAPPHLVVVPVELRGRWHGRRFLEAAGVQAGAPPSGDGAAARTRRLMATNAEALPGDLTVLGRMERVASRLDRLHGGAGTVADALVVTRTIEALGFPFVLPAEDAQELTRALEEFEGAGISEVRAASLTSLDGLDSTDEVEAAIARWIEKYLPEQTVHDALWVLEQQAGETHAAWWRRAVGLGLSRACRSATLVWGRALWAWWSGNPGCVSLVENYLGESASDEAWLQRHAPREVTEELLDAVAGLAKHRNWPRLFASLLGERALADATRLLRATTSSPEAGLAELLKGRRKSEVVKTAASDDWPPLLDAAATLTVATPGLLVGVVSSRKFFGLLQVHLSRGGAWPSAFSSRVFVTRILDEALDGQPPARAVVRHLGASAGAVALNHPAQERLWATIAPLATDEFFRGAAAEWWRQFMEEEGVGAPVAQLRPLVLESALERVREQSITLVLALLGLFPEITESKFRDWMARVGFTWAEGDHERVADLLRERRWRATAKAFRRSWKKELNLVAWHAQSLLSWHEKFWRRPDLMEVPGRTTYTPMRSRMIITFLAANPLPSSRLAIDEEARSIKERVRASKLRDAVDFRTQWAVRPEDLQQVLLEDEPTVVHFSGHGGGSVGIVFHASDQEEERLLGAGVLADLFRVHRNNIRVVVLNACHSEVQAQAIVQEIDFVVGMSDSIGDDAARVFAAAFYRALGFGKSVQDAFGQGVLDLKLLGLNEEVDIPILLVRDGVDASSAILVAGINRDT